MKLCRYPSCARPQHRFQLCNKHRKWVERGHMDKDTLELKHPIREVGLNTVCTIDGCKEPAHKARMCVSHYSKVIRGTMTRTGEVTRKRIVDKYARDFQCIICGNAPGRIVKGFCMTHYNQYRKGFIDFDGQPLNEPKKKAKYGPLDYCKVRPCGKRPTSKGFCTSHRAMILRGTMDPITFKRKYIFAKNKGKICSQCDQPAVTRGLCPNHYYAKYQAHPRQTINSGKTCAAFACSSPAYAKGLCIKHYSRRKRKDQIAREAKLPEHIVTSCENTCNT